MAGLLAGIALSIIQGAASSWENRPTIEALEEERARVATPAALAVAEEIRKYWSNVDDPNKVAKQQENLAIMQQGITGAQKLSPQAAMQVMQDMYTRAEANNRKIQQDATEGLMANQDKLAEFEATKMAPAQERAAGIRRAIDYSIMDLKRGSQESLMDSIYGGVGGILGAVDPTDKSSVWNGDGSDWLSRLFSSGSYKSGKLAEDPSYRPSNNNPQEASFND